MFIQQTVNIFVGTGKSIHPRIIKVICDVEENFHRQVEQRHGYERLLEFRFIKKRLDTVDSDCTIFEM
jgi:hypothetical protein